MDDRERRPEQALRHYATPGVMTDLSEHSERVDGLAHSPGDAAAVVQGLLIHPSWALAYDLEVPPERNAELQVRSARSIVEYWSGERWQRLDPQVDELQSAVVSLDFDPADVLSGQFLDAAEAWQRCTGRWSDLSTVPSHRWCHESPHDGRNRPIELVRSHSPAIVFQG